jgi:outer membrane lipopolysaccharide assembly protein LptE/RlpB
LFNKLAVAAVLILGLLASGCGYALAGRGSFLPDNIRVVGIPAFENRSSFSRVEQVLTDKVRTEFINRGKYSVIATTGGADAVLSGAITSIVVTPAGINTQQLASRYLFTVTMRVQFTDSRTSEILWSNDALAFREEYDLSKPGVDVQAAAFIEQEGPAFERISTDLARTVVSAILEAF